MNSKSTPLSNNKIPDPFDSSARMRLSRMGVIDKSGQLNREAMNAFADIFAGLFFDDIGDYYDDAETLFAIFETFKELNEKQDQPHMFLLLSLQYDCIRKPLPDPVWWLAGNAAVVREFMVSFYRRFECLFIEAGFSEKIKEDAK